MSHLSTILVAMCFISFNSCYENDYDPNATPKESYTNTISESYLPDKTKLLTLKEHGWKGERGHTQVLIEFKKLGSGSGVYTVDTTGIDIKTYWIDNNNIVIETKTSYKGHQKWNQVQSLSDIVKVRYIER